MFKFIMKATQCDPSGYYYPRWDKSQNISVVAETKDAAEDVACDFLGPTPRSGWGWIFKISSIEPVKSGQQ